MDEQNFTDQKIALEWIKTVEGETAKIREEDIYPRLRHWVNRASNLRILEIGAGQGICSDKIDLDGRTDTGAEPSPLLLDRAKQLYRQENRNFCLGNAYRLPFSDGAFDAVFSVAVWHLLSDLKKAAEELSRVLQANGHFLVMTANPGAYASWIKDYAESKIEGIRFEGKM